MRIPNFKNASIKMKLFSLFSALMFIISAFIFFYFPAKQTKVQSREFLLRMENMTDMIALGAGVGLGTDQLLVVKNVFDWAKQDSAIEYIVVLDKDGSKTSQYPGNIDLNFAKFSKLPAEFIDGNTFRIVRKIYYSDQFLGTILVGASMEEVRLASANIQRLSLIICLAIFGLGIIVAFSFGRLLESRLLKLVKLAEDIKSGNYNTQTESSRDEIGKLAQSLNEMSVVLSDKQKIIEQSLEEVKQVVTEVNETAGNLNEGKLTSRADFKNAKGEYRKLLEGFNGAIDNMLKPIEEASSCLDEMAKGNLTVSMVGDYKGDHARIKDALNSTLSSLNDIMGQVATSVDQVANGAQQVSESSQSLSQGATEQASSLEEITSSMTEMTSQTKQNAENATAANQLSSGSRNAAEAGNGKMKKMLDAMVEINQSSNQISKIIKAIDEIAFQTNLLALNAAVEAARAGVHGKGFAVVAEEVRNLAQRSAKAAKETTELIEGSVKKVENGTGIANETAKALEEIVSGITKVTDLVGEIASASSEQAQGIEQVNQGLSQIDQVTQSNTASAEESASAAEELSSQAIQLKQMLAKFTLINQDGWNNGYAQPEITRQQIKSQRAVAPRVVANSNR